jgi:uncharacterized protein (UPF0297 family)
MRKTINWSLISIFCIGLVCCAGPVVKPSTPTTPVVVPAPATPTPPKSMKAPGGLIITNNGIDFDDTHSCTGTYKSQTADRSYNEAKQLVGYKIETTCTTTNETHTQVFSDIGYNPLNQRISYQLELSCSRTGESHNINISQIVYDSNWDVVSYTADIDGKTYQYER